jgi:BarA-like signal transduction histidine kinase
MFHGYILLTTVASLRTRLTQLKPMLKHALPLADALLICFKNSFFAVRFEQLEQRHDLIQAISHPQFKLRWINTEAAKLRAKSLFLEAMLAASGNVDESIGGAGDNC